MSGPQVITLGCRLNLAESDTIRALLDGADDLVIVNSCAVTQEAVRNTRQAIRRARRDRPGARIVVTGCAAEIERESFASMPEVERVIGNTHKLSRTSYTPFVPSQVEGPARAKPRGTARSSLGSARQGVSTSLDTNGLDFVSPDRDRVADPPHLVASFESRTRAFVAVQNGCDHRCTFCIIPYGRGPSRSVPAGVIVDGIKRLVDQGCAEVVLTGVDVTSYGPDLPGSPTLGLLVERIFRYVPELRRLRLSSLDSVEIDERLHDIIIGEPRFMPHLHMSFQAGDDMILKRMKRRHSRAQAVETVQRIQAARPEVAIGADLIAGFPTETDEMAENSLRLIDECDIVMGHIFPYSPRPGTPAARMPQVPTQVARTRAQRLRAATARRKAAWLQSLVGSTQRVLFERGGLGHTESFAPVRLDPSPTHRHPRESGGPASSPIPATKRDSRIRGNDVVEVHIDGVQNDALIGIPA
ncbi:MAG TPA: tRNA (N(6)-L-threonylcarbamoyladenosine(37)-C(2))-methylthiotransferase MtaB [Allosphingosinicella sp.]|uniref:tRNA (N(6)-L-threonylcarbamoyladenosine(37)-C(2))- methylthiotransferase MtaB n=1 Tax=Allosphingosinicella sp. TaxID=2823234 RepID=UPI002F2AA86A